MTFPGVRGAVALVTGGGSGIGEAVAKRLAAAGAIVAVSDLQTDNAERVAAEIVAAGHSARSWTLDVGSGAAVEAVMEDVERSVGPLAILAHVAGVFVSASFVETMDDEFDKAFLVNARGTFHCVRAAARRMVHRKAGSIVTVASQSAKVVRLNQGVYGASKAAASYLTKACGLDVARDGIRCNVVHPGVTDTPLARRVWDSGVGSAQAHVDGNAGRYRAALPLGRVATTDAVADAVLFLASDLARHITMEDVVVDGGATLIA